MRRCGLLGEKLSHSYSPQIHRYLGDYSYTLFEKEKDKVASFMQEKPFDAINVTIPYKKTVVPYMDTLSETARRLGSVNTVVKNPDSTLFGHNTDYYGFTYMLEKAGISPKGKKVLVLGSGGASVTACAVLRDKGAAEVVVISRSGPENYDNISRHYDGDILVNTTPVGMYPHPGTSPVKLEAFTRCSGVLDLIYNPDKTALLQEAERLGIPHANGLSMLVAQAKESAEYFGEKKLSDSLIDSVTVRLRREQKNIVLIGMPGCGKSTLGRQLAGKTGRPFVDADDVIRERAGISIPEIFEKVGEEGFRALETEVLATLGMQSGTVLATGGGCVTRAENYPLLHQNGTIVWLQRPIETLPTTGRPLSRQGSLDQMYAKRQPLYARFADIVTENRFETEDMTERVLTLYENSCD
ncbi:MAG: shikimate kinase [Ruminococcaceae bacterium]|nr:shikimate kinase [Oscillospiraceae bacterium]